MSKASYVFMYLGSIHFSESDQGSAETNFQRCKDIWLLERCFLEESKHDDGELSEYIYERCATN